MRSRTALLGTLVLATALILVSPRLALTPGPLTAGHAAFANDCLSCHTILRSAPPPKCVACHPLDSIGISRRVLVQPVKARPALAGLHSEIRNADCLDCHTDHLGPDPAQATHAFSHEALGPERRQRCSGCHKSDRPADELHRQMGEDCTSCHTTQAWTPATFEHEQHFVLDRDHAASCRTCHTEPASYQRYTCYGCHAHTPAGTAAQHREEGITNLRDCARCHRSADAGEGEDGD